MKIQNLKLETQKNQKGQVALIVLIISAVVMTVGLSTAKKSSVDTRIETNEEQLKQAFNTAESGIEYYLGTGKTSFTSVDNLSFAEITVSNIGEGTTINYGDFTLVNHDANYWLVGHAADGTINFSDYFQGNSMRFCVDRNFNGALKVDYFYREGGDIKVKRFGYNFSDNYVSGFENGFQSAPQGSCLANYREIGVAAPVGPGITPLLIVAKPIRSGTKIYLAGSGDNFTVQGIELKSLGTVGHSSAAVNQTLKVIRTYQVPGFLLDAITSYGNVLSN